MNPDLLLYSSLVFLATILGGLVALVRQWSDARLHLFVSFGAGIFLGTVFLHLLPEALSESHSHQVPYLVLTGFLLIFLIERFLFTRGDGGYDHSHRVISITAFLGLSVHSLIDGFGLAVGSHSEELGNVIFASIVAHKASAAFALCSLFVLAKIKRSTAISWLVLFSLVTPIGAFLFTPLFADGGHEMMAALTGLTAGSFLYIATGVLLPEVFHTRELRWWKLALLLCGIVIVLLIGHGAAGH